MKDSTRNIQGWLLFTPAAILLLDTLHLRLENHALVARLSASEKLAKVIRQNYLTYEAL